MANEVMWLTPPFYTATKFDNTTWITHTGALGSIADSQLGLISFWILMDPSSDDTAGYNLFVFDTSTILRVSRSSSQRISIVCANNAASEVVNLFSSATIPAAGGWHHVMITWDLSTSGNRQIYIDGSTSTNELTFLFGPNDATHRVFYTSSGDWRLGSDFSSTRFFGSVAEFYFQVPATYFTDVTKFRSAAGFPVPLGSDGSLPTGVQPFIYLKNPFTSFGTNAGSGGDFTTTAGSLLNAPSIPP